MRVSLFGVIWLVLILISFTKKFKYTIYLQIFSFVFQSAWVVIIGTDLNAGLITSVFLILRYIIQYKLIKVSIPSWGKRGMAYTVYSLVISIIAPILFSGLTIAHMTNAGYNFNIIEHYNLGFSINNLTQPFAIILYMMDAIVIYNYCKKNPVRYDELKKVFDGIFYFVAVIGIIHVIFMYFHVPLGLIRELFHNEYQIIGSTYFDYYKAGNTARLMSTFYEPSYCGVYIAGCIFGFLMEKDRKIWKIVLAVIVGLLNMSSSFFITALVFAACYGLYRFLNKNSVSKRNIYLLMSAAIVTVILLSVIPGLQERILAATIGKFSSGSYDLRTKLNGYAWEAFLSTYGIGLGVNSIETSSLAIALLAQTGIMGTTLYIYFIHGVLNTIKTMDQEKRAFISPILLCSIIGGIASCSALNFSVFWLSIMLYTVMCTSKTTEYSSKVSNG